MLTQVLTIGNDWQGKGTGISSAKHFLGKPWTMLSFFHVYMLLTVFQVTPVRIADAHEERPMPSVLEGRTKLECFWDSSTADRAQQSIACI